MNHIITPSNARACASKITQSLDKKVSQNQVLGALSNVMGFSNVHAMQSYSKTVNPNLPEDFIEDLEELFELINSSLNSDHPARRTLAKALDKAMYGSANALNRDNIPDDFVAFTFFLDATDDLIVFDRSKKKGMDKESAYKVTNLSLRESILEFGIVTDCNLNLADSSVCNTHNKEPIFNNEQYLQLEGLLHTELENGSYYRTTANIDRVYYVLNMGIPPEFVSPLEAEMIDKNIYSEHTI